MITLTPAKCANCGNEDQEKLICEPSMTHAEALRRRPKGSKDLNLSVSFAGHRCTVCRHLTPLER